MSLLQTKCTSTNKNRPEQFRNFIMTIDKKYAVVVAGGKGVRMGGDTPKQFMELAGRPLLMHTIEAFYRFSPEINIIVVLPGSQLDHWQELCRKNNFKIPFRAVEGGASRFQSVKNGLKHIESDGLVAVHDGVRPLISVELIGASFDCAALHGSAVAAVPLKESIRLVDKDATRAVDRATYRMIQTPQTFKVSVLKEAYELEEDDSLTDDASVVERTGQKISLFEGSYFNIKVTTREDLAIAEQLLRSGCP